MSMQNPHNVPPTQVSQPNADGQSGSPRSAAGKDAISLVLCGAAALSAPTLLLPIVGFLPAILAGAGIIVAWAGLRGASHGVGIAVTGLIVSVLLFAVLAGVASFWNFTVVLPSLNHDDWFRGSVEMVWDRLFGS